MQRLLTLALLLLCVALPGRAGAEELEPPPVTVAATVDAADAPVTGIFTIRIDFTAEKDVGRAWGVVVEFARLDRTYLTWDQPPTPPPLQWKKGDKVTLTIPAPYPADADPEEVRAVEVRLGFRDPESGVILPPRGSGFGSTGTATVAELEPVVVAPVSDEARIAEVLQALEFGLRGATEDAAKARFRDAMTKLGDFAPRPLTGVEQRIVERRIEDERRRYLRQQAGRLRDRGQLHAALRILESVGGKLQEAADAAVIGALNDAKRAEKDLQDLREEIWDRSTPEERAEAEKLLADLGPTKAAFDKAHAWIKEGRLAPARRVLKSLAVLGPKDVAGPAASEVQDLQQAMLAAAPSEDSAAAEAALHHPAFARTAVSFSHEFIFIGPKSLVDTIPAPSRSQFDLAYVFLTDLFGRRPNPGGDRVTVYFKELWDFGGGVGGGKTIDIGNARADAKGTRVDTGLLFHELTHCVDDTSPIYAGFREGLADFGAAFSHEALGRAMEARVATAAAIAAFRADYAQRDLEYRRMPNYGPSAGFLLSFSEKYAKNGTGHDWKGWRKFFREFRDAPVRDGREPYVVRAIAHYLIRAFGPGAFDDLITYRFPLVPSDREAVAREIETFADGDVAVASSGGDFDDAPNTPRRRDLDERSAIERMRAGDDDGARRVARDDLGIVFDWHVIGPFEPEGADPGAQVFPPEQEIDFAREYPQRQNIAKWRRVGDPGPVEIDALGWVAIKYAYMDNTATYALTHATVPAATDAFVHVRADDDFTLFVNGERIDGFIDRGWNDSTRLWWRGPIEHAPDAMRLPVHLRAGRNQVLLKIRNRGGPAGFVLALSRTDGRPLEGLRTDDAAPDPVKPPPAPKWHPALKLEFPGKGSPKGVDVAVGAFEIRDKLLSGTSTAKDVAWRKYTVRPGFPKDSPSNLLWLRAKDTEGADDFRLTLTVVPPKGQAPKLGITFQGEGGADGLSGWNVLLWNAGGKVAGQVERYEDLIYQWSPAERAPSEDGDELILTCAGSRLTLTYNGAVLLDRAPIRAIPGKYRIGLITWGTAPKFDALKLERD